MVPSMAAEHGQPDLGGLRSASVPEQVDVETRRQSPPLAHTNFDQRSLASMEGFRVRSLGHEQDPLWADLRYARQNASNLVQVGLGRRSDYELELAIVPFEKLPLLRAHAPAKVKDNSLSSNRREPGPATE